MAMDGLTMGVLAGQRHYANGLENALENLNEAVDIRNAHIAKLNAQIAKLELALSIEKAHSGGLKAQVVGFIEAHPNSPVRAPSGKRYKDGRPKSVNGLRYDAEFDRIARSRGIVNPEAHRPS